MAHRRITQENGRFGPALWTVRVAKDDLVMQAEHTEKVRLPRP